jgi:hypothetical protein
MIDYSFVLKKSSSSGQNDNFIPCHPNQHGYLTGILKDSLVLFKQPIYPCFFTVVMHIRTSLVSNSVIELISLFDHLV